jgi:hypothetical protein
MMEDRIPSKQMMEDRIPSKQMMEDRRLNEH